MITESDLKEAIVSCRNLKDVAQGFGISSNALRVLMDMYEIIPENLIPEKEPRRAKPKPYIHETDENGVRCVCGFNNGKYSRRCFYGSNCGGMTCCDYMLITDKRRPIADKFDTHYCTAFLPISKSEKQKMKNKKSYGEKRLILREYLERNGNVRENT